jgi:hypothetical protein
MQALPCVEVDVAAWEALSALTFRNFFTFEVCIWRCDSAGTPVEQVLPRRRLMRSAHADVEGELTHVITADEVTPHASCTLCIMDAVACGWLGGAVSL